MRIPQFVNGKSISGRKASVFDRLSKHNAIRCCRAVKSSQSFYTAGVTVSHNSTAAGRPTWRGSGAARRGATQVERSRAQGTLARTVSAAARPTVSLIYGAALLGSFSSVNYLCVIPSGPKSVAAVNNRLAGVPSSSGRARTGRAQVEATCTTARTMMHRKRSET